MNRSSVFILVLLSFLIRIVPAQVHYNHPELNWHTIETEHFYIHYHDETERSAREGAEVAEKIYPHITGLYQHEPKSKTHLIFIDTDDFSNGAAYYYDNKIYIWATPLDYDLRGSHRWLQNVITHEFTHIISIQKAMKASTKIPGAYFQWMGYEEYKRKDVLYGFPNRLVSYPVPGTVVPPWLAEGVSQYMYDGATWDTWDSHRDMILRDRVLNDKLLSFDEMNSFGKKGIGNESVYNAGYALCRFIGVKYGSDAFRRIMDELSHPLQFSISSAMEKAVGKAGTSIYDDFAHTLEKRYAFLTQSVRSHQETGRVLLHEGTTNIYPVWNPDGTAFAYLSNKGNDYFGQTELYVYDLASGEDKKILGGISSAVAWHPNGNKLYISRRPERPNRHGSRFYDIYEYDLAKEEDRRLTVDARAFSPVYIAKDSTLAYLGTYDGSQNIHLLKLSTGARFQITDFQDHRMIHSLKYDAAEDRLIFDYTNNHFRNIGYYAFADSSLGDLLNEPLWDERNLTITPDGKMIYADDRTGIYNLYFLDPATGAQGFITNVLGGAFMPSISAQGKILYSLYDNGQYNIAILDSFKVLPDTVVGYSPTYFLHNEGITEPLVSVNTDDAVPYHDQFAEMFIMPKLMVDYGTLKPGFYFYSGEIIDRLTLFGGASVNAIRDLDLFFLFEFKRFYPTLFLESFYLTRNIQENNVYSVYQLDNNIRYRMTFFRGGLRFPILGRHSLEISTTWQVYRAFIDQSVPGTTIQAGFAYDYYRGWVGGLHWHTRARKPRFDGNINPSNGYVLDLNLNYEKNDFIEGLNLSDAGTIVPEFSKANNLLRFEGESEYSLEIPKTNRWTVSLKGKIGWMNNTEADSFFNFFAGGLYGIKGYPFYSVEGNRMATASVVFRVPLFREKQIPLGWVKFQNSVIGFEYQYGDAWSDRFEAKPSIGIQWRINGYSFYNFPTAIGLEVHRGLKKIQNHVNDQVYTYGKENRVYFTLLFGF